MKLIGLALEIFPNIDEHSSILVISKTNIIAFYYSTNEILKSFA